MERLVMATVSPGGWHGLRAAGGSRWSACSLIGDGGGRGVRWWWGSGSLGDGPTRRDGVDRLVATLIFAGGTARSLATVPRSSSPRRFPCRSLRRAQQEESEGHHKQRPGDRCAVGEPDTGGDGAKDHHPSARQRVAAAAERDGGAAHEQDNAPGQGEAPSRRQRLVRMRDRLLDRHRQQHDPKDDNKVPDAVHVSRQVGAVGLVAPGRCTSGCRTLHSASVSDEG
jgi:hypothetical protein